MNPFTFFMQLKPSVKITLVVCFTLILIASMAFGCFDDILALFGSD